MSDDFDPRAFGHRLRVTRLALGISEQEVAGMLGVSQLGSMSAELQ
jgi:hypothetical protein